jgi:hypothetical protein
MSIAPWVAPDTSAWVHHPASAADWEVLRDRFEATAVAPLARVLDVAKANRCRTVIEENRYVDPDFRSEYTAFWADRFRAPRPFTRRLHFFKKSIAEEKMHQLPADPGYLGYCVVKPLPVGRVGRTVLAPPPRLLKKARLALTTDEISLFGRPLSVTGAPFCEQDGEFLRCAHAASWMAHYHAACRGSVGRHLTAQLVDLSPTSVWHERALPSPGLTLNQIQAVFASTGQPALFYGLSKMPEVQGVDNPTPKYWDPAKKKMKHPGLWDTRIFSVLCRYLNAGFPAIITTENHAFTAVGWFREGKRIRFVVCDDQWGPYETVTSPFTDRRAPWTGFMIPLPPKVYLTGEMAESTAHYRARSYGAVSNAPPEWVQLKEGIEQNDVSLRTFLRSNLGYKSALKAQGRDDAITRMLQLARLPHWVWVVELHDRDSRRRGKKSVLAEFVFDSTSSDDRPGLDLLSLPGATMSYPPDGGKGDLETTVPKPWRSQLPPI